MAKADNASFRRPNLSSRSTPGASGQDLPNIRTMGDLGRFQEIHALGKDSPFEILANLENVRLESLNRTLNAALRSSLDCLVIDELETAVSQPDVAI